MENNSLIFDEKVFWSLIFHSNVRYRNTLLKQSPLLYKVVLIIRKTCFYSSVILSKFFWFDTHIKIGNNGVFF